MTEKVKIKDASREIAKRAEAAQKLKASGDLQSITKPEYDALVFNPETDPILLDAYSIVTIDEWGLQIGSRPDPDFVEMDDADVELENAMAVANNIDRRSRLRRFRSRLDDTSAPVIVAEGDSWFQFPKLVADVIDHLSTGYNVACLSAAGDTAENMIFGNAGFGGREYLSKLIELQDRAEAFMFSGAGNDIIGSDPATGESALKGLLKNPGAGLPAHRYVDHVVLKDRLDTLERYYRSMITSIRAQPGLDKLPIIIHGYDYAHPFEGSGDNRKPVWALRGGVWLAPAFVHHKIRGQELRREIIKVLIDALYDLLEDLAGDSKQSHVWVVDCRKILKEREEWADEIHPTSKSFFKVAKAFNTTIFKARDAAAKAKLGS